MVLRYMLGAYCLLAAIAAGATPLHDILERPVEPPPCPVVFGVGYANKALWRGLVFSPGPTFVPSVTLASKSGFTLIAAGYVDASNIRDHKGILTTFGYKLDHIWKAKHTVVNAGLLRYEAPHREIKPTHEIYWGIRSTGRYVPGITIYYDFDEAHGFYAAANGAYTYALPHQHRIPATTTTILKIGWGSVSNNRYYYNVGSNALVDATLDADISFALSNKLTLIPSIKYSICIDNDIRDAVSEPNVFAASIALTFKL